MYRIQRIKNPGNGNLIKQTRQYRFSQWAETDRILREDFNADDLKAEQALGALAA